MEQTTPVAFDYIRDDARRRIRVIAHGALHGEDLTAIVTRQATEGTGRFGMLYDLRAAVGATQRPEARAVSELVQRYATELGPGGPVAIVTRSPDMIAAGQIYAYEADKVGTTVEVFWDLDEAQEWLGEQFQDKS